MRIAKRAVPEQHNHEIRQVRLERGFQAAIPDKEDDP
jgi:hypothetical protein